MSESPGDLTPKGQAARDAIMAAGAELFAEHGAKAVSITDIATRAGVNRAMIAYYFGSKGGLYDAIIDAGVEDVATSLGDIDLDVDGMAPERRLILAFAEALERRPNLIRMILYEYFQPSRLFEPDTAKKLGGMIALTRKVLERVPLGPKAQSYDSQVLHLIIVGSLNYFIFTKPFRERLAGKLGPGLTQPSVTEFAETLADLVSAGLRAIPRT